MMVLVVSPPLDHLRLELLGRAEAKVAQVDVVRQGEGQLPGGGAYTGVSA